MNDLKRLLRYVRPYWLTFVAAFIAMILTAVFETATGALLVPIFNQFVPSPQPSKLPIDLSSIIPRDDWYRAWISIAVLMVAFTVLKGIAEYFSSFLMAKIGQSAILNLRQELYDHLLRQSASFFEKHRTNFLVSRLVVSCAAIELAVSANLRDVLRESLMLIFFFGAAFYFNWRLTLGAMVIAPMIGMLTTQFSKRLRKLAEISVEGNKLLTDTAQEAIANHAIVKAYHAEEREKGRFKKFAQLIANSNLRSGRISAISPPTIDLIGVITIVALFYFGLREINAARMDAAEFFTFIFFLLRSYDPMRKISRQHNEIARAFAAAHDVWDIIDDDETLPERPDAVVLGPLKDAIVLKDVSFNYRSSGRSILQSVDLKVPRGSMVALVGESGGGKSSLIKLVQRLYDPTEGSITWDGTDLRDASILSLKKQLALVTQETVLFNDTIRYNISYGNPDATDADIEEAARVAFADEFIDQMKDRYDTIVGERGTMLSGGQRQRIAIARAVLVNAPVLILDEATSALDTERERLVQRALGNLTQNKTSIVIAHRLSTIRRADKIVVMEKGKIVESGTHDELLEHGGRYKKLYEIQFAPEEYLSESPNS
ncbi:MAG: ABC transporter transmembrane domain-containing protein [Acidobacteriota bacterium]